MLTAWLVFGGCGQGNGDFHGYKPAATVSLDEGQLGRLQLLPGAEARLQLKVQKISSRKDPKRIYAIGEILVPPGSRAVVTAPVSGVIVAATGKGHPPLLPGAVLHSGDIVLQLSPLVAPNRDLRIEAQRDADMAAARLATAESNVARLRSLGEQGAGDQSALEQAEAARSVANAELQAARKRIARLSGGNPLSSDIVLPLRAPHDAVLTQLQVAIGQTVAAGAPLFEVADLYHPWIAASLYVGDVDDVDRAERAQIRRLGAESTNLRWATPLPTPDQGIAATATATLFYQLELNDGSWMPGQRVEVLLPSKLAATDWLSVPLGALLYDLHGDTWVYAKIAEHTFERRAVLVDHSDNEVAYLKTGPEQGTDIVTQGAAELFGLEFGARK